MATHMNPNHPMCKLLSENWEAIIGLLVYKLGGQVTITMGDLEDGMEFLNQHILAVDGKQDSIKLYFVDQKKAEELAKKAGGLPN